MKDPRAAAIRFTLVSSAVLLSILAQVFIRDGGLQWAVAPLVVAVACLALDSVRARIGNSDTASQRQLPFDFHTRPAEWSFRLWNIEFTRGDLGWASIITACLLMSVSLRDFGREGVESLSLAWYCFGAAVVLLLVGIAIIDARLAGIVSRVRADRGFKVELRSLAPWLILGAILVVAAGVRLYNLEDVPAGLWYDEASNLSHARMYAEDPGQIPVYEPATTMPTLFLIPVAGLVKLAGVSVTSARIIAALFGVIGIAAVFLFVRQLLGSPAALIAATLVAFMRWDIIWSRIGFHASASVMFAALAGWLTLRAARSGHYSDYALAGASLGLGMWFYTSNRIFPLVAGFILIHHFLINRPPFRRFVIGVCLMALSALFVAAPVVQYALDDSDEFFKRTRQALIFDIAPSDQWLGQINENLEEHLLMFNRRGDPNPRHNLPDEPMLDFVSGGLFALGFFFALTQWRSTGLLTLPFWVLLMLLPGVLTVPWESPQSLRSILVIPAVAALTAYPLQRLWSVSKNAPWSAARRFALPGALGALGFIAYVNVEFYFDDQANDPRVYAEFSTDELLMAESHEEQQRRGYSIWVSRQFLFGLTGGLLGSSPKVEVVKPPQTLPLDSTQVWHGAAVYFEPRERGFWELARAYYPDAEFDAVTAPTGGKPMFYTAFISREQLEARQGLNVAYTLWDEPVMDGPQPIRDFFWHTSYGPQEYPYDLRINGALKIDAGGEYEFELDSGLDVYVELDGLRILTPEKPRSKVAPAVGLHRLLIRGRVTQPDGFVRVLWKPPGGELEQVPFSNLYRGTARPMGAVGRFFKGDQESGLPDAVEIAPSLDVFSYFPVVNEPHTVVWEGMLNVKQLGEHKFAVEKVSGPVKFYFEGDLLAQDPPSEEVGGEGEVLVGSGSYPIRIEYVAETEGRSTMLKILWQPPDGKMTPIPVESLSPSREYMLKVLE